MWLKNRAAVVLAVLALVASGAGVRAQTIKEGELAGIKSLKCTFSKSTLVAWKDGVPEPRIRTTGTLTLDIDEIDAPGGSAILRSSSGSHDINVQVYGWNIHFLEVGAGGRIGIATVFAQFSTGDRLKAVYSRSDYLPIDLPNFKSEPEVAQYYGDCEVTR